MPALFRFPFPITTSTGIPGTTASRVLMVGTAFRGGPPTQFLGYSNTDYSVIPNLLAQPRAFLEASNPSPIASPLPSALSANLCVLCGNLFSPSFNASTSKVAP